MVNTLRSRTYRLLGDNRPETMLGRVVNAAIIVLIVLNVIATALETVAPIYALYGPYFDRFDVFSIIVFTAEYFARIWIAVDEKAAHGRSPLRARLRYMATPLALIDLATIAPFYLSVFFAIDLRMLRVFRLLRLFKLTRYWSALHLLLRVLRDEATVIGTAVFLLLVTMVLASGAMFLVERQAQPEAFGSIPAAMWWTVSTLTTVGYGDVVPITVTGKLLAGMVSLLSIGMVAFPSGILAAGFVEQVRRGRNAYQQQVDTVLAEALPQDATAATLEKSRTELGLSPEAASHIVATETQKIQHRHYCPHCGESLNHDAPAG
jgi:voltage-gated potassium channel